MDPADRFCGECGHDNGEPGGNQPSPPSETAKSKPSRRLLLLAIAVTVICCVVVLGGYLVVRMAGAIDLADFGDLLGPGDPPSTPAVEVSRTTKIWDAWVEHNLEFEGQRYMVIHVESEALQNDAATAAVVGLIWTADESPMTAHDPEYELSGQAAVIGLAEVTFSPSTYWDDYQLWIPYYAMETGENSYATIELQDADTGRVIDLWETGPFSVFP